MSLKESRNSNFSNNLLTGFLAIILATLVAACGAQTSPAPAAEEKTVSKTEANTDKSEAAADAAEPETLILMSHDSFDVSPEVISAFEEKNKAKIEFLNAGDAGATLNQAILSKENPLADVFWGVDNTFFSRAIDAGIFEAYDSPRLGDLTDELKLDPQNRLIPVDYGDVCLNYDKGWFEEKKLAPPGNLEDLVKAEYAGLTVVENPATSSPGLAFLMATVAQFGESGYLDYWQQLADNEVLVVNGWSDAYYSEFTRYEGAHPLVVSYASSPPAEVFFAEEAMDTAPTGSVVGNGSCFRQIEFIGILAGTEKRDLAEKFIDFMLSSQFQEDIPLKMFVFPANKNAALPDVFVEHAQTASNPATLPPEDIAAHREDWINAWTETVLR